MALSGLAHHPRDPLPPTPNASSAHLGVDPCGAARPAASLMNAVDLDTEPWSAFVHAHGVRSRHTSVPRRDRHPAYALSVAM